MTLSTMHAWVRRLPFCEATRNRSGTEIPSTSSSGMRKFK